MRRLRKAKGQSAELELKLLELKQDYRKEVLEDLQVVEGELSQLSEKRMAIQAKLRRLGIRAPVFGRIHELSVHTVGGVIGAGDTLANIVPENDKLVVDALVAPNNIDRVHAGAPARIRFTAFDRPTTPELTGTVMWVSPEQQLVGEYKRPAFRVRIGLDPREIARLGGASIRPGMEAEVMLTGPGAHGAKLHPEADDGPAHACLSRALRFFVHRRHTIAGSDLIFEASRFRARLSDLSFADLVQERASRRCRECYRCSCK